LDGLSCDFFVFFVVERKNSAQEKVLDDSQTPQVHFLAIRLLKQNLRGNIT